MKTGLFIADCVEYMAHMPEECIDLTVTSPPYDDLRDYKGYTFNFENIAKELYRVTKQGGVIVWIVADKTKDGSETGTSFQQALYFKEIGFRLHDTMIFAKPPCPYGSGTNRYFHAFEYMFVFSKGKPKTINLLRDRKNIHIQASKRGTHRMPNGNMKKVKSIGRHKEYGRRTNIWEYPVGYGSIAKDKIAHEHPAIFPEKLAEDHILSWSNTGDLVFDPMCGSGTTGKMALKNNRHFIGVDISEEYIAIATERLNALQMNL